MNTLVLVSGSLRSFRENIRTFPNSDIAVYIGLNDEDTYLNLQDTSFLFEDTRVKLVLFESIPSPPLQYKTEREKNTYKQWYKFRRLLSCVSPDYHTYIRIRPDVYLYDNTQIPTASPDHIQIPIGNDRDGINDQISIGTYEQMRAYANTLNLLVPDKTSEYSLKKSYTLPIKRFPLQYKLVLSVAKIIAIAGDSGSGKSTLCKLLRPLFLFDKVLEFETDRYHKWERGHEKWKEVTHLNPIANHLEKLENDTFNLRIGNTIHAVDYDHSTGMFTPPTSIEPGDTILLCGLHTLYSKQLRDLSDLKIYVDTSDELKVKWKLQRDITERNQPENMILNKIELRKPDYDKHIAPQKEHANITIKRGNVSMILIVQKKEWCSGITGTWIGNAITITDPSINVQSLANSLLTDLGFPLIDINPGFDGVIQLTVLRALYNKNG